MSIRLRLRGALPFKSARAAIGRFGFAIADQKVAIVSGMGMSFLIAGLELVRPWPIKLVVDHALQGNASGALPWISRTPTTEQLILIACAMTLFVAVAIGQITVTNTVLLARVGRKVTTRLRRKVSEHLHRLALPFHDDARTGDLLSRVMGDVSMVRDILFQGWISFVGRTAQLLATIVLLVILDSSLALIALAPTPILALGLRSSARKMKSASRKQRRKEGSAASCAVETLRQIHVVKAFGAEDEAVQRFTRLARSGERAGVKAARIAASSGRFFETVTAAGLACVLFIGANRVLSGEMTLGVLLVCLSYTRSLYKPLRRIARDGVRLSKAAASYERLEEIMEIDPEPSTGPQAPRLAGRIEFRNVDVCYPNGSLAIQDVSTTIEAGTTVVLRGPNGAGKSTFMSLMLRLVNPTRGSILVDGSPIDEWNIDSWRERMAYVPQDDLLFDGTVFDNVIFGRADASPEDVQEAARRVSADEFIRALPEGYDTVIGEDGSMLSGGQRRKLALARAAVRDADVYLFDEPLGGLDDKAKREVNEAIERLVVGRTAIIITHEVDDGVRADATLQLHEGRLSSETTGSRGSRR